MMREVDNRQNYHKVNTWTDNFYRPVFFRIVLIEKILYLNNYINRPIDIWKVIGSQKIRKTISDVTEVVSK